jgi:hypothetical protein
MFKNILISIFRMAEGNWRREIFYSAKLLCLNLKTSNS